MGISLILRHRGHSHSDIPVPFGSCRCSKPLSGCIYLSIFSVPISFVLEKPHLQLVASKLNAGQLKSCVSFIHSLFLWFEVYCILSYSSCSISIQHSTESMFFQLHYRQHDLSKCAYYSIYIF